MNKSPDPAIRFGISLAAFAVALAPADSARASSVMWNGGAGADWFTTANWVWDGVVPGATDTARIESAGPTITGATASVGTMFVGVTASTASLTVASILNAGTVTLGYNSGASGSVTVSGSGASWINSGTLTIGDAGTGTVEVTNGGTVTSTNAVVGNQSGASGTVTVSGSGSSWTDSGRLGIGKSGGGTLTVSDGGQVQSAGALLGWNAGASGSATVTGAGSTWTNTDTLYVGNEGNGTLSVADGGSAVGTNAYVGTAATSTGTVTVDGAGSAWTLSGILNVGYAGTTSSMTISNGGLVHDLQGAIAVTAGSSASVTVTGAGSTWETVASGGVASSGILSVGWIGTGTLTVADGATVSDDYAYLGDQAGSSGNATVTGSGSSWTNTTGLMVGKLGNGSLTITDSGTVSAGMVTLGYGAGTTGTIAVGTAQGAGTLTTTGTLVVGQNGTGTLTVANGGAVSSSHAVLGSTATGNGTATVTGSGSSWNSSGNLYVGNQGTGSLTVSDSGTVTSVGGYVGTSGTSTGTVSLSGGSSWTLSDSLIVGYESGTTGTISVTGGALLQDVIGTLGDLAGSTGSMTVSGSGSRWTNVAGGGAYAGYMNVGRLGTGTLTVTDGGAVSAVQAYLGTEAGSSGTATVSGTGSSWTVTNRLFVGADGTGTLTVSDGGTVSASQVVIAYGAGSTGTLSIGGAQGQAAAASGTLDTAAITFGDGTGTLYINVSDASYTLSSALSGNGTITKAADGVVTLTGNGSAFTGTTTVAAGTLVVGSGGSGSLGGTLAVQSGATLSGSGSVGTVTVAAGGTHAPGTSIGTQTVTGNYTLQAGSTLRIEVGDGEADTVAVTGGTVTLSGASLSIVNLGGTYSNGLYTYTIIDNQGSSAVNGTFASLTNPLAFYDASVDYSGGTGNDVVLSLARNRLGFVDVAATSNQRGVANRIGTLSGNDGATIRSAILGLTTAGVRDAYTQLSGNIYPTTTQFNLNLGQQAGQQVGNRMASLRAQAAPGPAQSGLALSSARLAGFAGPDASVTGGTAPTSLGIANAAPTGTRTETGGTLAVNGAWTQTVGGVGRIGGDGNTSTVTYDWAGLISGYDVVLNRGTTIGAYVGYIRGNTDQASIRSSVDSDTTLIGLYGEHRFDGWYLDWQAGWSRIAADSRRILSFGTIDRAARADYADQTLSIDVEAARPVELGPDLWIEPYAGGGVTRQFLGSFTESGADAANLHRDDQTRGYGHTRIGVRVSSRIDLGDGTTLIPQAGMGWRHLVGPAANQTVLSFAGTTGSTFAVNATDSARDTLTLSAGGALVPADDWQAFVSYAPSVSEKQIEHSLVLGMRTEW